MNAVIATVHMIAAILRTFTVLSFIFVGMTAEYDEAENGGEMRRRKTKKEVTSM